MIRGVKLCKQPPRISYMLFADDSYMYCKVNEDDAMNVVRLLHKFEYASGKKVNLLKSSLFFSTNVSRQYRVHLCNVL